MEVFRITVLSLLLWMAIPTELLAVDGKVGEEITLPCTDGELITDEWRSWNRGSYSADKQPPPAKRIYKAKEGKIENGSMLREDMKFDPSTFAMTLTIQEDGFDNDNFTCRTEGSPEYYTVQEVLIFFQPDQPNIETTPSDLTDLKENDDLTVTCIVPRLYPEVGKDDFKMTSEKDSSKVVLCPGNDCVFITEDIEKNIAKEYNVTWTRKLTSVDDGASIVCKINPAKGDPKDSKKVVLNVYSPIPPPSGLSGGEIAGIVVGSVAGAVLISVGVYFGIRCHKKVNDEERSKGKGGSSAEEAGDGGGDGVNQQSDL